MLIVILAVAALICAILSAIPAGRVPLWVSVILLCVIAVLLAWPGK